MQVGGSDRVIVRVDEGEVLVSVGVDPECSVVEQSVVPVARHDQVRHARSAPARPADGSR
jgi:hypothetical protein